MAQNFELETLNSFNEGSSLEIWNLELKPEAPKLIVPEPCTRKFT